MYVNTVDTIKLQPVTCLSTIESFEFTCSLKSGAGALPMGCKVMFYDTLLLYSGSLSHAETPPELPDSVHSGSDDGDVEPTLQQYHGNQPADSRSVLIYS